MVCDGRRNPHDEVPGLNDTYLTMYLKCTYT